MDRINTFRKKAKQNIIIITTLIIIIYNNNNNKNNNNNNNNKIAIYIFHLTEILFSSGNSELSLQHKLFSSVSLGLQNPPHLGLLL